MSHVLVRFHWDCGRQGDVTGLFITTAAALNRAYDKRVYFGEILGKHSDISGTLERSDIEVVSEDQDFIQKLEQLLGTDISGYNPLDYIRDEEEE
ncbi:hypothetical protein uav_164 [Pseudomonas phage UAVern]|uniref:Uncharacterized protein n=1 Tax=Pseudomonas phage UAVern TaxID=2856997 RepID=A0A975UUS8_9CAUD|nr:hypothetical protein uav_164 [Pseudomonas phage UAVern]